MNKVMYALAIAVAATFATQTKTEKPPLPKTQVHEEISQLPKTMATDSISKSVNEK
jgi:hypothetical protein